MEAARTEACKDRLEPAPSLTAPKSPILMMGWDLQERLVPFLWSRNMSSPGIREDEGIDPPGTGVATGPPAVPPQPGKPAEQRQTTPRALHQPVSVMRICLLLHVHLPDLTQFSLVAC